jgi:hypothetical protein
MVIIPRTWVPVLLAAYAALLAVFASTAPPARATATNGGEQDAAAACPGKGTRFIAAGRREVYLVGPGEFPNVTRLYWIWTEQDYFKLWGTWDGIATLPGVPDCWSRTYPMYDARLVKDPRGAVYIWDPNLLYRRIVDWATFTNIYHFDPSKIGEISQSTADDPRNRGPDWN